MNRAKDFSTSSGHPRMLLRSRSMRGALFGRNLKFLSENVSGIQTLDSRLKRAGMTMGSRMADYLQLIKPRLVFMVLLSTVTGYYLSSFNFSADPLKFWMMLLGTAFVACGSMTLNEVLEVETDSKMIRTQNRPLPAGRLSIREALIFGGVTSVLGFTILISSVNWLAAALAFATWAGYLFVYTPLKSKTSLSTVVGAVPGALPPLIGWASASGHINFHGFILFLIMFFWQLPHFLAIAWMYREDYERAGLPILSVIDRDGTFVSRQMILNMCALMPVSLLPTIFTLTGTLYFFGAFSLGIFFAAVIIFASSNLDLRARWVLRASVIYLASLLILMVVDKL